MSTTDDDQEPNPNTPTDARLALPKISLPSLQRREMVASQEQIIIGLTRVLALVAPTGFDKGDRKAWLAAAAEALHGVPPDLLFRGIEFAMLASDHPSNIVKNIMREIGGEWKGWAPEEAKRGKPKYISATGYVYFSTNPEDVMREAERRADWSTYYMAKVDMGKRPHEA